MIRFPLDAKNEIEVPSLGFGPKWSRARHLLAELTRVRRIGFDPATPLERLGAALGLWKGPLRRLKEENRLWRALFHECQGLTGYSKRRCRKLLDGPVTYAHRHEYEQILLYGEIPLNHRGLKKSPHPLRGGKGAPPSGAAAGTPSPARLRPASAGGAHRSRPVPPPHRQRGPAARPAPLSGSGARSHR